MTNGARHDLSLDPTLCDSSRDNISLRTFSACLNARGLYESQRFALRLSPVVHALVNEAISKSERGETSFSGEEVQAYSTYLHETVHWWQHKGSTSGFIRSLLYPVQTHSNLSDLRRILAVLGPEKPVQAVALRGELGLLPPHAAEIAGVANTVTNNFMDTEFYLALTLKPSLDVDIYRDPYFEAAGHSFLISYALVLGAVREMIDSDGSLLPDPAVLIENLAALAERRVRGYFYESEIVRAPVGLMDLYEGQARFIQLQFLAFSSDGLTVREAEDRGMLQGVYGNAFRVFLELSNSSEPELLNDPLVALFMAVCDMSINPTVGFPAPIGDFETFFLDADPGIRFAILCKAIADHAPELRRLVVGYTADEYRAVVRTLSDVTGLRNHLNDLSLLDRHARENCQASTLVEEHRSFKFTQDNIVLRVLTGEFLAFVRDRLERPEFFCWTGHWLTVGGGELERALWLKHLSLFSDKVDDGALFARLHPGRDEGDTLEMFNQFYASMLLYDLTKQWVLNPGEFRLEYSWLTSSPTPGFIERVKGVFIRHFGVGIDQFVLVDRPAAPDKR
jgi:hypothetical protein